MRHEWHGKVYNPSGLAETIPLPLPTAHGIIVLGGREGEQAGDTSPP